MVEKLEIIFVGELDHWVFQRANLFEHLRSNLWIEADSTVLELIKRRVESLVYIQELLLHPFYFGLILDLALL